MHPSADMPDPFAFAPESYADRSSDETGTSSLWPPMKLSPAHDPPLFLMDDMCDSMPSNCASIDQNMPCPRLASAVFSARGRLVMFNNLTRLQDVDGDDFLGLPRSYLDLRTSLDTIISVDDSALNVFGAIDDDDLLAYDQPSASSGEQHAPVALLTRLAELPGDEYFAAFYDDHRGHRAEFERHVPHRDHVDDDTASSSTSGTGADDPCTSIAIIDLSSRLFPIDSDLAAAYTLIGRGAASICMSNQRAAIQVGNQSHASAWGVAALICQRPSLPPTLSTTADPWARHPLGGKLARRMVHSFARINDLQMASLLASAFEMCLGADYSNDTLRASYAADLYAMGLVSQRAELLAFTRPDALSASRSRAEFALATSRCSLCRLMVKGVFQACSQCLHGGHRAHLVDWFKQNTLCPVGTCQCRCQSVN